MKMSFCTDENFVPTEAKEKISVFFEDLPVNNEQGSLCLTITKEGMKATLYHKGGVSSDSALLNEIVDNLLTNGK